MNKSMGHYFAITLWVGCFLILFPGCSGTKSNDDVSSLDSLKADSAATSIKELVPEEFIVNSVEDDKAWDETLKKYFTPEQATQIKKSKAEFEQLETAAQLAFYYKNVIPAIYSLVNDGIGVTHPDLFSGDDAPSVDWKWFSDYYPATQMSVDCSECMYGPSLIVENLKDRAKQTNGEEDDLFFEVLNVVYEPDYELLGCDFCAAYKIGNGRNFKLLQRIASAEPAQSLFEDELSKYRMDALQVDFPFYLYKKTDVLKEINDLLKIIILTDTERNDLIKVREKLEKGESNAQFNCGGNPGCNFDPPDDSSGLE